MMLSFIYALGITGLSFVSSKLIFSLIQFDISKRLADQGYKTNYNQDSNVELDEENNYSFDPIIDYIPVFNVINALFTAIRYAALREDYVNAILFTDCVVPMSNEEYNDYIKEPSYLNYIKMSLNNYRRYVNDSILVTVTFTTTQENIELLKEGEDVDFTIGLEDKIYRGTIKNIEHIEDDIFDVTVEFIKKDITKKMISKNGIYIKMDDTIIDKINNIGNKNNDEIVKNVYNKSQDVEDVNQEDGPKLKLKK